MLRIEALPPADAQKVSAVRDMKNWKNPYLIVRVDGVGLLDPANNEQKILTPDQLLAALGRAACFGLALRSSGSRSGKRSDGLVGSGQSAVAQESGIGCGNAGESSRGHQLGPLCVTTNFP